MRQVCRVPLVAHCLTAFENVPYIDKVVLVCDNTNTMKEALKDVDENLDKIEFVQVF